MEGYIWDIGFGVLTGVMGLGFKGLGLRGEEYMGIVVGCIWTHITTIMRIIFQIPGIVKCFGRRGVL